MIRGLLRNRSLIESATDYLLKKGARPSAKSTEFVQEIKHRHHFRLLPDEHPVVGALYQELGRAVSSILLPFVSELGSVVEFAAFITNPGAQDQPLHSDIAQQQHTGSMAPLYSCFIFLTDIGIPRAALRVVPRSHALSEVREAMRRVATRVSQAPKVPEVVGPWWKCLDHFKLQPVEAGDAAIYDGTSYHGGSANYAEKPRIVVYMSVMGIGEMGPGGVFAIDNSLLRPPARLGDFAAGGSRGPRGARAEGGEL